VTATRRDFLKTLVATGGMLTLNSKAFSEKSQIQKHTENTSQVVYRAVNGTPSQNIAEIIEMMGGIERIIGSKDVVLIKPNVQWWNQGASNLLSLKTFVDLTMERPGGFNGEVVLAENCHRGPSPWTSTESGWAHDFKRNSDISGVNHFGDLCNKLKNTFGTRFSVCHLIDVDAGGRRINNPFDGFGYVYCDGSGGNPLLQCENGASGTNHRATIMTYPILKTDRGTVIDFKNRIWNRGSYTGQPLRFFNFCALNHHSTYWGIGSGLSK